MSYTCRDPSYDYIGPHDIDRRKKVEGIARALLAVLGLAFVVFMTLGYAQSIKVAQIEEQRVEHVASVLGVEVERVTDSARLRSDLGATDEDLRAIAYPIGFDLVSFRIVLADPDPTVRELLNALR